MGAARWALWDSGAQPGGQWLERALQVKIDGEEVAAAHGHGLPLYVEARGEPEPLRLSRAVPARSVGPRGEGGEVWTLRQGALGAAVWLPWRDSGANTSGPIHLRAEMERFVSGLWREASCQVPRLPFRLRKAGRFFLSAKAQRLRQLRKGRPYSLGLCSCTFCLSLVESHGVDLSLYAFSDASRLWPKLLTTSGASLDGSAALALGTKAFTFEPGWESVDFTSALREAWARAMERVSTAELDLLGFWKFVSTSPSAQRAELWAFRHGDTLYLTGSVYTKNEAAELPGDHSPAVEVPAVSLSKVAAFVMHRAGRWTIHP